MCGFCPDLLKKNKAVDFVEPNPPKDIEVEPDKKDDRKKAGEEESRPVDVIPIRRGEIRKNIKITFI